MKRWPEIAIRVFGALQWFLCAAGLLLLFPALWEFTIHPDPIGLSPYYDKVFLVRSAINLIFVISLVWAGYFLLKLDRRGITATNWIFLAEFAYFFLSSAVGLAFSLSSEKELELVGNALAATAGTGDMGIAPHFVTGYSILALIVLNLARRKLDRSARWPSGRVHNAEPGQVSVG